MELPADLLVRDVPGHDDLVAFEFPFELEGKAVSDSAEVEVLEDGDLIIDGFAAVFDGVDRQGENFMDGAFEAGIKSFLDGPASLCFHHKREKVLGKVLELQEVEGKGLKMRARIDGAIKDHPELGTIYRQIKKGTLTGLSVGGYFKRKLTPNGKRIANMDFTEISITGVPVHAKPAFSVVAGKALDDHVDDPAPAAEEDYSALEGPLQSLSELFDRLDQQPEGKAVKGEPQDLHFLALVMELEKFSNELTSTDDVEDPDGPDSPDDQKVDELVKNVKDGLDQYAREAHKLAAKLGPLPRIQYV